MLAAGEALVADPEALPARPARSAKASVQFLTTTSDVDEADDFELDRFTFVRIDLAKGVELPAMHAFDDMLVVEPLDASQGRFHPALGIHATESLHGGCLRRRGSSLTSA
jgi:hypothetical protein